MAYLSGIWSHFNEYKYPDARQQRPGDPRRLLPPDADHRRPEQDGNNHFDLMALPFEIRQVVYQHAVLGSDWLKLDCMLNDARDTLLGRWYGPPKASTIDFAALCRAHPQLAREAWPVWYKTAVPRVPCSRKYLKGLNRVRRPSYFSDPLVYPLLDVLGRFRYMRLDMLGSCREQRIQDLSNYLGGVARFREIGIHIAIEDLALTLRSLYFSPAATMQALVRLLHHPHITVFLWSYPQGSVQNEALARSGRAKGHSYRAGYDAREEQIEQVCKAMLLDRSLVVPGGWRPDLMVLGSKWAQPKSHKMQNCTITFELCK